MAGGQRGDRQVRLVGRHSKDAHGIRVEATLLPSLHCYDGRSGLDDVEVQSTLQTEAVEPLSVMIVEDKVLAYRILLSTSVCHCSAGIPRGSGYQNG